MINKLKLMWIKHKTKGKPVGGLVPIVTSLKIREGVDLSPVKEILVKKMEKELMNYIYFEKEETEPGVILMKARIDVLRRDIL